MPHSLFVLARLFLRVDNVLFRMFDVRVYHSFGSGEVVREVNGMEAKYDDVKAVRLATPNGRQTLTTADVGETLRSLAIDRRKLRESCHDASRQPARGRVWTREDRQAMAGARPACRGYAIASWDSGARSGCRKVAKSGYIMMNMHLSAPLVKVVFFTVYSSFRVQVLSKAGLPRRPVLVLLY
jgi:hypothetical protein